jgi:hypothetical protein
MTGQFEQTAQKRDPVADWRYTECLRILDGPEYVFDFAASNIDLHLLERMARSGATPRQLKEWLL